MCKPTLSNFKEIISVKYNNNTLSENAMNQILKFDNEKHNLNINDINNLRIKRIPYNNDYDLSNQENFSSTNFHCTDSPTSLSQTSNISNVGLLIQRQHRAEQSKLNEIAEAWNLLVIYIVGQIRFGYELECLLQQQRKKLIKNIFLKTLNNNQSNFDNFNNDINGISSSNFILKNQDTNNKKKGTIEIDKNFYDTELNTELDNKNKLLNIEIKFQKNNSFEVINITQKNEEKLCINQNIIENISINEKKSLSINS